jgi:hypothetical protein
MRTKDVRSSLLRNTVPVRLARRTNLELKYLYSEIGSMDELVAILETLKTARLGVAGRGDQDE